MQKILASSLLLATFSAAAIEAPSNGTVHNTRDRGWLSYDCGPVIHDRITCSMIQVLIRKKLLPADVDAKYQEQIKGWPETLAAESNTTPDKLMDSEPMRELCSMSAAYIRLLRGTGDGAGLPKEAIATIRSQNALQRRDNEQHFRAILESCQSRNIDGLKRATRIALERDARTCLVATNPFEQTFRPVRDPDGKLLSWSIADTRPQGDCGFVHISRFIPEKSSSGSDFLFWNYVGKRATSNPEAKTVFDISCKDWDESETVYEWKSKEIALQCDYIEYSPI